MNRSLTARQRSGIRIGAGLARALRICGSLAIAATIAAAGLARHLGLAGGWPWTLVTACLWGSLGAFAAAALVYLPIRRSLRCPNCGGRLVPDPFGRAPRSFELHPSCGRLPGIERWQRQADRIRRQRRCRCVRCGEDFDLARPSADG